MTRAPDLARALSGIRRAAAAESPVLLLGEPGSGRSTLARALHEASPRRTGPRIDVDPGAVPLDLLESDLFGHRPGAFTGATKARAGRVERAAGGTLVLDHVEELPLSVQPKLLRLLSDLRFAPLGGRERRANVRFVAIGVDDLPWRVEQGAFRQDLYYRLDVLAFRIPPLRQRRADMPALLDTLLDDLGERFERPGLTLSDRARVWMQRHSWPGNLRQLRNLLERELVLARGNRLDPPPPEGREQVPQSLLDLERQAIRQALAYTRGHQGEAAELLGISRKALWQKRKRYGIP